MDFRTDRVVDLVGRVRRGELQAIDLTEHALAQIEARNPALNAFVALDAEGARRQATELDERLARGEDVGPLAGIPIGVKDLEAAAGFVTTFGSALHADDDPAPKDSTHVARLRAAGCVILGKTNTPEHGWTAETINRPFGTTRNPWALDRSPGGSSGGSAAAIAAGLVPLATGSDGGGSIRIPAALCGLSGLKPSQGRVPNGGTTAPGSGLLGVKGPMARRIRDVAYALDVVVGPDPIDPYSLPAPAAPWYPQLPAEGAVAPPARVLWAPTMGYDVDHEVLRICQRAIEVLAGLGTEIVEVEAVFSDDPVFSFINIWSMMRLRSQGRYDGTDQWELIDPGLREQILYAREHLGPASFGEALDDTYRYNAELSALFEQAPLLLSPTVAGQTPFCGRPGTINGGENIAWVRFTYALNMTRHPAGTVNAGFTADGMPVGLQIVGPHFADLDVLLAVACVEDALAIETVAP